MTATCGRLESAVYVGTAWTVAADDGVAYVGTVAAGTYSGPTAVLAALVASLNTAATGAGSLRTWTGSIASGEQGTGKSTLTISAGANITLNWTSTNLRDLLGFAAGLSGAITFTSPSGCLGMWLPDCPFLQPFPSGDTGDVEADITTLVAPTGATRTVLTTSRTRHPGMTWSHVSLARSRKSQESNGVRSFQRIVEDCMIGSSGLAYFLPGSDIKVFWSADSSTAQVYHCAPPRRVADVMQPSTGDGWVGLYRCTWPGGWT